MSSPPSDCMATTPRCRSWPRARRSRATSGPMSATTARSGDGRRRPRSITPRAIAGRSILPSIFRRSPASCKRTPTAATTRCTTHRARRDPSCPHFVGRTPGGSSSSWRTSPPICGAVRMRRRSRRSHWRLSGVARRRPRPHRRHAPNETPQNYCHGIGELKPRLVRRRRCGLRRRVTVNGRYVRKAAVALRARNGPPRFAALRDRGQRIAKSGDQ